MALPQGELPTFGLGDRLRKAREFRDMSIETMAEELTSLGRKTSGSSVSGWERNETQPRRLTELVGLWATITGIPENWFWGGNNDIVVLSHDGVLAGQMALPLLLESAA